MIVGILGSIFRRSQNLDSDAFYDSPAEVQDSLAWQLAAIDSLAPLLRMGEREDLLEVEVGMMTSNRPFLSWEITSGNSVIDSLTSGFQLQQMLSRDESRGLETISHANPVQLDSLLKAYVDGATIRAKDGELSADFTFFSELDAGQRNAAAAALFQAALNLHDEVRARQWLDQIVDPAARAEAEKKLPE